MAWSEDMRCLHCDGKLPLYRKITNGQFCSSSHRRAYWEEQERLAVERLHQTHDSLRAHRPAEELENALVKSSANRFYVEGNFPEDTVSTEELARKASNHDRVVTPGFVLADRPKPFPWASRGVASGAEPIEWAVGAPLGTLTFWQDAALGSPCEVVAAGKHSLTLSAAMEANVNAVRHGSLESIEVHAYPIHRLTLGANPDTSEFELWKVQAEAEQVEPVHAEPAHVEPAPLPEPELVVLQQGPLPLHRIEAIAASSSRVEIAPCEIVLGEFEFSLERPQFSAPLVEAAWAPLSDQLLALPRIAPRVGMILPEVAISSEALEATANLHIVSVDAGMAIPEIGLASLHPVPLKDAVTGTFAPKGSANAVDVDPRTVGPVTDLASPVRSLRLRLGRGCRYAIEERAGTFEPRTLAVEWVAPTADRDLSASLAAIARTDNPVVSEIGWKNAGIMLPLAAKGTPVSPETAQISSPTPPVCEMAGSEPVLPVLRLEPLEGEIAPSQRGFFDLAGWNPTGTLDPNHIWSHAVDFWQHAPRDMKLLAVAIPVLLGLALHPSLPKVRVTAPAATGEIQQGIEGRLHAQFVNVKHTLANRAGVELNDDFRTGLDDWQTRGDLSAAWSFDSTGFVKPSSLALYRPSMRLADYDMQFLGLIDKKAMSFVARAQDFDNYYVIKLVVLKPGPLPTIGLSRYAVIDGKAQTKTDVLAPIEARPDMLYRVSLSVYGDTYLLSLQGKVVDSWTEKRLTHGGVGFFANRGEESRLRWIQVTHQYDMLGRLCAYLAPYEIPTTNGSW